MAQVAKPHSGLDSGTLDLGRSGSVAEQGKHESARNTYKPA